MTELGVHVVGEIDRRRALRQVDHAALRRQHVDRVVEEPGPELLGQLARVADLVLPFEDLAQPRDLLVVARARRASPPCSASAPRRRARTAWCISWVRICTSTRLAFRADHRRVQRAVVVALRAARCSRRTPWESATRGCARGRARRSNPSPASTSTRTARTSYTASKS